MRVPLDPGIGDEDVEPPEMLDGGSKHRADLVLVRDIGFEREGVGAGFTDLGDDRLGLLGAGHVIDPDIGPGATQRQGDRPADAGIGAGDERLLALQRTPVLLSSVFRRGSHPLQPVFVAICCRKRPGDPPRSAAFMKEGRWPRRITSWRSTRARPAPARSCSTRRAGYTTRPVSN